MSIILYVNVVIECNTEEDEYHFVCECCYRKRTMFTFIELLRTEKNHTATQCVLNLEYHV